MKLFELKSWAPMLGSVVDLVYPRQCLECGSPEGCSRFSFLCERCFADAPRLNPPYCAVCSMKFHGEVVGEATCPNCEEMKIWFDRAFAMMRFRGVVRRAIHGLKYSKEMYWARLMEAWFLEGPKIYPALDEVDVIVPVPLHDVRRRERGFNQAVILGKALSGQMGKILDTGLIRRVRFTEIQASLDREERMENQKGAFEVVKSGGVLGKRVLLVDDVLTTGSTASECARVLRKGGATSVLVFTLARG